MTGAYLVEAETACLAVSDADTCGKEVETGWLALDANSSWTACSNTAPHSAANGKARIQYRAGLYDPRSVTRTESSEQMILAHWALTLSMSREEHYVTGAALRLLAPVLLTDRSSILTAAAFYRKHGDEAGARWWEQHLK